MGAGDWLMCTGEVKRMYAARPIPVHIVGVGNKPQTSPIFANNPKIKQSPGGLCQLLKNGSGLRPYIQAKNATKWYWREYEPIPGELYFSDEETRFAAEHAGRVMIEPNVKVNGHANKAWPFERWQWLVRHAEDVDFVQCGPDGTRWLDGVSRVLTPSFRHACAVLSVSRAFVGTEGGLMHAAAALDVPAVVLWSHYISPSITGYQTQTNIRHASEWCGSRVPCKKCQESMAAISVDEVEEKMRGIL